ncbi:hypothetical protein [Streptococcus cristatus]|uniref:hypothetical protein n=1 Tax=Streptococcus cristatus TaxID=45634 RepID=UPI000F68B3EC|nr:hypothetical protein [Streptococcus cristatus]RSJ73486.1 hypothetical protein D8799_04330 [Streptococcus cristatus]
MKVHKKEIFFLLPLFFFYFVFYILLRYVPMDSILSKGLVVGNVLIYSPLATLLMSLLYAALYGFSLHFSFLVALLFFLTIFTFGEWIPLYHAAYFLCSLAGNGLGHLIYLFSRKNSRAENQ